MRRLDRDLAALLGLGGLVLFRHLPDWFRGLTAFWGDLTYIHLPWRSYDAQLLSEGRLPLWNPYIYGGMPQAAGMQDGLFYPGSAPHWLFGFATATAVFTAVHYWLGAALAYLALRGCGARRVPAFGGAALSMLGGVLLAREGFLNHLAALSLAPALLLFFDRPLMLALALAAGALAGYPPYLVGSAVVAWVIAAAGARRGAWSRRAAVWTAAGVGAAAASACLLLPAIELVSLSRRSAGVTTGEALVWAFRPGDLLLWLSPRLIPGFSAAVDWTRSCHLGFVGAACVVLGLAAAPRRRAAVLAGWLLLVAALLLAGSNALSTRLWEALPGLRWVRYPGNLAYLAVLPLCVLAAAGLQASRYRLRLAAALCAELLVLSWGAMPRTPRADLASPGPLAARLASELEGRRYLISPRALESSSGKDVRDWRHRLYGLTNAPARLRALGNFGEPLVPRSNYDLMDLLYSAKSPAAAHEAMIWSDVGALLTPEPVKAAGFVPAGQTLWHVARVEGAAGARLLRSEPPAGLGAWPKDRGKALAVSRPREDAFSVSGSGAGWLFAAEPLYPGWRAWLETDRGPGTLRPAPALGPFQKTAVPSGSWAVHWRYEPPRFAWGLALSAMALLAAAAAAARRAEAIAA